MCIKFVLNRKLSNPLSSAHLSAVMYQRTKVSEKHLTSSVKPPGNVTEEGSSWEVYCEIAHYVAVTAVLEELH